MPTIHDCERCTKDCPQRQLAREQAEKRMYATNEFVSLQQEIEAGLLVRPTYGHWLWNKFSGEVRCKNCKALVGVCFSELSLNMLVKDNNYCYNCGAKMQDRINTVRDEQTESAIREFFDIPDFQGGTDEPQSQS